VKSGYRDTYGKEIEMRYPLLLATACFTLVTGALLTADDFEYAVNQATGDWMLVRRIRNDGPNTACIGGGPGECYMDWDCTDCHAKPASVDLGAPQERTRHLQTFFPRAQFQLAEGRSVSLGAITLTRSGGRLVTVDAAGRRHRLPPNAAIVTGKTRQPAFVMYSGDTPPERVP
jgi:hypothetical protein